LGKDRQEEKDQDQLQGEALLQEGKSQAQEHQGYEVSQQGCPQQQLTVVGVNDIAFFEYGNYNA
jgi:hypothetical protein